ncbi:MAG: hypothetical protein AAGD96_35500, partial [Chloroflexota bacterium]
FLSIATMLLILFLYPPLQFFAVWRPVTPDKRPALMTLGLVAIYVTVLEVEAVREHFGIVGTPEWAWGVVGALLLFWFFGFRFILKHKWVEKLFVVAE